MYAFLVLSATCFLLLLIGRRWNILALRAVSVPLVLLGLASAGEFSLLYVGLHGTRLDIGTELVVYSLLAFLLGKLTLSFFFDWVIGHRTGVRVPLLARDLISGVLYLVLAGVVAKLSLGIEVGALLTTSAVITVILGLALQQTLGALFGGIVLILEGKLETGQWIRFGETAGRIEELGWRSLMVRTVLDEIVLIPNSQVTGDRVTLLGSGHTPVGLRFQLEVGYGSAPDEVAQVLKPILEGLPDAAVQPAPMVFPVAFAERGITYECRHWTTNPGGENSLKGLFFTRAYRALQRAGMELPVPTQVFQYPSAELKDDHRLSIREALAGCSLFQGLPDDAIASLARDARRQVFAPGEALIRQGSTSCSMFVLSGGQAEVMRRDGTSSRCLAVVGPGDEVGEVALLTGKPRGASVVAKTRLEAIEVDGESIRRFLSRHPEVQEELATRVTERELSLEPGDARRTLDSMTSPLVFRRSILDQLRRFIGIPGGGEG